jgi:hypothetical protein
MRAFFAKHVWLSDKQEHLSIHWLSAKPIEYSWSHLACIIGHSVPIWQPTIGSLTTRTTCPVLVYLSVDPNPQHVHVLVGRPIVVYLSVTQGPPPAACACCSRRADRRVYLSVTQGPPPAACVCCSRRAGRRCRSAAAGAASAPAGLQLPAVGCSPPATAVTSAGRLCRNAARL